MTLPRPSSSAVAGLLLVAACGGDPVAPAVEERPESGLTILRLAADAPPLFNPEVSFWAKRGQSHDVEIHFQDPQGQRGDEFLEFELDQETLLNYPDGRPFAPGDSVLITIRVVDAARILFEFEPAGLQFNPLAPAELEISYRLADPDLNGDGDVDDDDRQIELQLAIWRQAVMGGAFVKLATVQFEALKELEAALLGFSRLAIAY